MKHFRQLVKELHPRSIVFTECRFQPPSAGYELLVNAVKKIAESHKADHIVLASNSEDKKDIPLIAERKVYYLKRMFPGISFAEESKNLVETTVALCKKYKEVTFVTTADRVMSYKTFFEQNSLNVKVTSAGDRDPSSISIKMKEAAKLGNFEAFKKGLPYTLTELDGKRLMNEMRQGMGLEIVKEQIKFETNTIREKYFAGEIFQVGEIVESNGTIYKIVKRGSNHLLVEDQLGNKTSKWPQDLQITEKSFTSENLDAPFDDTTAAIYAPDGTIGNSRRKIKIKNRLGEDTEDDLSDIQIEELIQSMTEEDYLDAYEDEDLIIIDEETEEFIDEVKEEIINEVLSRQERIRAKLRFSRSKAKRERKIKIALKTRSNTETINKRARKLAIATLKKLLAKRSIDHLPVAERERIESKIAKMKKTIDRVAMRLVPKVKKIESDRLAHKSIK